MKEEVKKADSVDVMIASQLEKFEVKEEELQSLVAKYSELVVTGVNDKAGRKAVSEARKHLKATRTGITNIGKDLRDIPNKLSKAIIKREKEFIDIISPEEDRLAQIESDIAEEEEELRKQKEYEEQQRIIARTKELEGYGATFNGVQYELGENILTMAEVRLFTDTEFNRAATFFKEDYENFKQLELQAEIEKQNGFKERYNNAYNFLIESGYIEDDLGANAVEYHHFIGKKHYAELDSEESLAQFKIDVSNFKRRMIAEKEAAEAQRIADEALKAEQAKLAEIAAQQKAQQAELDRKQKELDDQLAAVQKQKMDDARTARQNQYVSRRAVLLNTKTLLSQVVINDIDDSMYGLSEEGWNNLILELSSEYKAWDDKRIQQEKEDAEAEEKRRIEMQPDMELLQGIIDKLKKVTGARPAMKTAKGAAVLSNADILIGKTITYIEAQIKNL